MTDILKLVEEHFGTVSIPYNGPTYILPNGKLLDLSKHKHHSDVERWLIENKLSNNEYIETAGSKTLYELGCIRCDTIRYYIALTPDNPTDQQYNSLLVWLHKLSSTRRLVEVFTPNGDSTVYKFSQDTITDYIVDRIRRYYSSGRLYEQTEIQQKHQFNFVYSRKPLGEELSVEDNKITELEDIVADLDMSVLDAYSKKFQIATDSKVSLASYNSTLKELINKKENKQLSLSDIQDALIQLESEKQDINNELQGRLAIEEREQLLNKLEPIIGKYNAYYFMLQSIEAVNSEQPLPKYIKNNTTRISDRWSVRIVNNNEPISVIGKVRFWDRQEPLIQLINTKTHTVEVNIPYGEFINNGVKSFSSMSMSKADEDKINKFLKLIK